MRFPIKTDLTMAVHKRSIIIQSELGAIDFPVGNEQYYKHRTQYMQDKGTIFANIHRLIKCIADCQLHFEDGPALRNALELGRSLGARVWDNSPLQMKQIPNVGPVAVRKLNIAGIPSIETLEATEPCRINSILGKQPGFGETLLHKLKDFPKVRLSIKSEGLTIRKNRPPIVRFSVELGFMNERTPHQFNRKPVYVCFLAEKSDGHLIEFKRLSASAVGKTEIRLSTEVLNAKQMISCFVMCEDIAGTFRSAELYPQVPSSAFPIVSENEINRLQHAPSTRASQTIRETGFRRASDLLRSEERILEDGLDDCDLLAAARNMEFPELGEIEARLDHNLAQRSTAVTNGEGVYESSQPAQLDNGKWLCNHKCKDKTACKHLCCREGVDHPPKQSRATTASKRGIGMRNETSTTRLPTKTFPKSQGPATKVPATTQKKSLPKPQRDGLNVHHDGNARKRPQDLQAHSKLHSSIVQDEPCVLSNNKKRPLGSTAYPDIPYLRKPGPKEPISSDFDTEWMDDFPAPTDLVKSKPSNSGTESTPCQIIRKRPLAPVNECDIDRDLEDYEQPILISSSSLWSQVADELEQRQSCVVQANQDTVSHNEEETQSINDLHEYGSLGLHSPETLSGNLTTGPSFKTQRKKIKLADKHTLGSVDDEMVPGQLSCGADATLAASDSSGNTLLPTSNSQGSKASTSVEQLYPDIFAEFGHIIDFVD